MRSAWRSHAEGRSRNSEPSLRDPQQRLPQGAESAPHLLGHLELATRVPVQELDRLGRAVERPWSAGQRGADDGDGDGDGGESGDDDGAPPGVVIGTVAAGAAVMTGAGCRGGRADDRGGARDGRADGRSGEGVRARTPRAVAAGA
ncbi:hypothetical protein [Streptomyces tricolor]|uniref:hypothetical protein n=1 Tax=Streptomyces tricolor TaxID=68277 RepID=UPI003D719471